MKERDYIMNQENVILYGLGSRFEKWLNFYKSYYNIIAYCDSDSSKKYKVDSESSPFILPNEIYLYNYDVIIITSSFYNEIKNILILQYKVPEYKIKSDYIKSKEMYEKNIISFGNKNTEKVFGIIRNCGEKNGLFYIYRTVLGYIKELTQLGYLPIVDMQNTPNAYLDPNKIGQTNSWEYFFKQPSGYSLADCYSSAQVVDVSKIPLVADTDFTYEDVLYKLNVRKFYYQLSNKYIKMQEAISKAIEQKYQQIFNVIPKGEKVCGVLFRGTDYSKLKPYMHYIQPSIEMLIEVIQRLKIEWGFSYIYIATEEQRAVSELKKYFGDKVLFLDRLRFSETGNKQLADIDFYRENDRYIKGMDYLTEIMLLSRCNFIIAGKAFGTYGAVILSEEHGGYEKEYYFELGVYGVHDDSILHKQVQIKKIDD